jgi:hypothetical protein
MGKNKIIQRGIAGADPGEKQVVPASTESNTKTKIKEQVGYLVGGCPSCPHKLR